MKTTSVKTGDIYPTNKGGPCKVLEYINYKKVLIQFLDKHGHTMFTGMDALKTGNVKNPYTPNVYGVGYFGHGKFKGKINNKPTYTYSTWQAMIRRCYNGKSLEKYATYKRCTVIEEWHNYQTFAQWLTALSNYSENMQLDKDILCKGNKVYSPTCCALVPLQINQVITAPDTSSELPQGVMKCRYTGQFIASLSMYSKQVIIGRFETPEEAFKNYKDVKESHIKNIATQYKDSIEPRVYKALNNWEV